MSGGPSLLPLLLESENLLKRQTMGPDRNTEVTRSKAKSMTRRKLFRQQSSESNGQVK